MARIRRRATEGDLAILLQNLLAIELYRGGLSKAQIRQRLGIKNLVLSKMLRGVNRHTLTRTDDAE